ncbi:hypothetical protein CCY99_04495 [Helicobacter sp. 16-1353]|uniref:RecB-like helicase n=1 Tax=Helicobacter sp. 16-1353 TaxID=2004996 RepID=UPI000DCBDEC3|nr:RecB-like helicase [Helicobacter sp. 16-1353]RAX54276.1 hypothetical protein CCY99_04495 [Helicobacter sp. 16-1353]
MQNDNQWLSIRASAGSGKTFSLTSRYIYLLLLGANANEILTITFTRKAQQEMQERILRTLRELASDVCDFNNNPYAIELSKLGLEYSYVKDNIKKIYYRFRRSNNHIMTFDAFFNLILKKFSFYAGLLNNYELGNDFGYDKDILQNTLEKIESKQFDSLALFCFLNELKANQILEMLKNIKIDIATDSSIDSTILDWRDVVVSNYNELQSYVLTLIDGESGCKNIMGRLAINLNKDSTTKDILALFHSDNTLIFTQTMINKLEKLDYDESFFNAKINRIKEAFKWYFDNVQNQVLSVIVNLYRIFHNEKLSILRIKNVLNFNDLNLFCYELLNKHIDKDFFYFRLDSRINHILVDEFQDTNIRQYQILKPLIDEIKSGVGRIENRSLFFVGDEKQAIYRFRGSDSRLFEAINKELNMNVKSLPKNYRSAKNIVEIVNQTFSDRFKHYETQIPDKKINGYVKILTKEKSEILDCIKERVNFLLKHNRKDIVILTRNNATATEIRDFLLNDMPHLKIALQLTNAKNDEFLVLLNVLKYIQTHNNLYIKNALVLNGGSYFTSMPLDSILLGKLPSEIVLNIMKIFHLYGKVAILVLEKSLDYNELDEFIDELENTTIEIEEDREYDIRISNIHKAKGLEFDDVILSEFNKENNRSSSLYYDYDGLNFKQIVYLKNAKFRQIVDLEFKKIYDKQKDEKLLDSINLLYVAFTRAKESLYIIKPTKSDLFDKLSLQDIEMGEDIDSNICDYVESKSISKPIQIEQESFGKQDDFIQDTKKQYNSISRIKGIALHLAMEYSLRYRDSITMTEIKNILLNRYGLILDKKHIEDILSSVERILNNSVIKETLSLNPHIKCEVSYLNDNKILRRIDCILETKDSVFILDYKSSDLDLETKQHQVREYLHFATKYFVDKKIAAYLCFADGRISQV